MNKILHAKLGELGKGTHREHDQYEYTRYPFIRQGDAKQSSASVYEVPPGKSSYPYHYHIKNEELFFIISGQGILKTPEGERPVGAGDMLFFPANEHGAHKLTNSSETEMLVYLDFDTDNDLEVSFYPDSGKIGVWGEKFGYLYRLKDEVEYYEGE